MIGVDYKLFWKLNPKTLSPFIKAFELKQKHDDHLAWQQGAYIRMAILSSMDTKNKYPEKPMLANKPTQEKQVVMSPTEIRDKMMKQLNGNR